MERYKYLFKNIGLLTLSNFGTKLLSFFLVPLYTSILSTTEYGAYDLLYTTASLLLPIFTIDIADAVLRFSLDKDSDKTQVFSIGVKLATRSFIFLAAFLAFNYFVGFVDVINQYLIYFVLFYVAHLVLQLMQYFARGIDRIADLSISGVLNTAVMIALNIVCLLVIRMGIYGYFLASIFANIVAAIYLLIRTQAWKYVKFSGLSRNLEKDMTAYSRPLVINLVSWWVNNASDRYIVTWICGVAANGIYSVGYKIPSILNIFQNIFNQAWQLSTVKELDREDSDIFYSRLYGIYDALIVGVCSVLIVLARILAKFLYANDFYEAWKYVPFLMIAIVFGSLYGFLAGIFTSYKASKIQSRSVLTGALCNVVLNFTLVSLYGPIGAAIATAISYFVVWVMGMHYVKRYVTLKIKIFRDLSAYILLVIQSVLLLLFIDSIPLYLFEIAITLIIAMLYWMEIKETISRLMHIGR